MKCMVFCLLAAGLMMLGLSTLAFSDPGITDTVKITGGPLIVGQSRPLAVTIVNDENIGSYYLGLISSSIDGGFARYDSVVYINRMADPSVLNARMTAARDNDGIPPDSTVVGDLEFAGNPLPPGNTPIMYLYFTGLSTGTMSIDSGYFPPAGTFMLVDQSANRIFPEFVAPDVDIQVGYPLPQLTISSGMRKQVAGETVQFSVDGWSPASLPVTLELASFSLYDDPTATPVNAPSFPGTVPSTFTWNSTSGDIGIWEAVFRVCDSHGQCVEDNLIIQMVGNAAYFVDFDVTEIEDVAVSSGLSHGNFDSDQNAEVILPGTGAQGTNDIETFDYIGPQNWWVRSYGQFDNWPRFGAVSGFFNADEFLDFVTMKFAGPDGYIAATYHGDGAGSFTEYTGSNDGHHTRSLAIGEFTGDNHLDLADTWYDGVYIFSGNSMGDFADAGFIPMSDSAVAVTAADFNGDGHDDLAVGTKTGVKIYLSDGSGGFDFNSFYPQSYGALDVEVTNEGSDFNGDGIFDLCVSTPSVGGMYSEMVVYLGNGDGTFDQEVVRTVKGQIFGNCVGDFNNDTYLDVAYLNGAEHGLGILYGDGDGSFTNEVRYFVTYQVPYFVDCFDADLDGDRDIIAAAHNPSGKTDATSSLFYFRNLLDPAGFASGSMTVSALDNASLTIHSPSGHVLSSIATSVPSGEFYRRNINDNAVIDEFATMSAVENGGYQIEVQPKSSTGGIDEFSLEFTVNDEAYRLAKNEAPLPQGMTFRVYTDESSPVLPRSGSFVTVNPPSLIWQGDGDFDIQIASDIAFATIIEQSTVSGSSYSPATALPVSDTALYYWRVRPHGAQQYGEVYAVNIVGTSQGPCGDLNGDGVVSVADMLVVVNYVFRGGAAPEPLSAGDFNCDGTTNISDAVYFYAWVFRGGPAPCCE